MKVVATIEARMTSSRLSGKSMKSILGKPMLQLLIERVKNCKKIDAIVVATTENATDDIIEELSKKMSVNCFRESENVSNYIYEHPEKYKIAPMQCPDELNFPNLRFTVDEESDFELVKTVFENLYPTNNNFRASDVIKFLNSNLQVRNLNKHVIQR